MALTLLTLAVDLVALAGGIVHTLEPGVEPAPATLILLDGHIQAVADPDEPPPAQARVIDVSGKHVLPGLIDAMVYFDPAHDALYVSQGITTVRDMGGDPVRALLERLPGARERVPGPLLLTPGAVIDGDPPASAEAVILRTPEMADELLPILINEEVDFLSVHLNLGADPFARTLELAHEAGLEVWGPVPRALSLRQALAGGMRGVLFLDGLLPEGIGWPKMQLGGLKAAAGALVEADAGLVPVLRGTALRLEAQRDGDAPLDLLDPIYEHQWLAELSFREGLSDEQYLATGRAITAKQLALVGAMDEMGVALIPGSGSPHPWLFPGLALHDELQLWEQAGIAPARILELATREAARRLGLAESRGTLAPGKVADVVVVDGDPREGVAALRDPQLVIVRGHVLDRSLIDDRLANVRGQMQALRAAQAVPIKVEPPELPEGAVALQGRVEVYSVGVRIRAERYAVVKEPDGSLTYCGRTSYRTEGDAPSREMDVLQRTRAGKLDEFIVSLTSGEDVIRSHGIWVAETMRIERRMNGTLVDTKRVRDRLTCVDVGSVTSLLILTQLVSEEPFQIVTFHELLEPELALWVMGFGGNEGLVHYVRTHKGAITFQNSALGSVELSRSAVGGGTVDMVLTEEDGLGGPGLRPPAEKLARVGVSPDPEDAGLQPPPAEGDVVEEGDSSGGDGDVPEEQLR